MQKNLRAQDQELFSFEGRDDVTKREHGLTSKRVFELLLAILGIGLGTTILVSLETMTGGLVCTGAGVVLLVFAIQSQKSRRIIERSEFLNALLASAVESGRKFCCIATEKKGQIVYMNDGFQKLFPEVIEEEKRTIAKLFSLYKVDKAKAKAFNDAVKKATKKTSVLEFDIENKSQKIKLVAEPISRPSGFVLIRGA